MTTVLYSEEMNSGSEKLIPVQQYCEAQFPGFEVANKPQPSGGGSIIFTVHRNKKLYRLVVSAEFLADYNSAQIHELLTRWDVASAMRGACQSGLVVTRTGVKPE